MYFDIITGTRAKCVVFWQEAEQETQQEFLLRFCTCISIAVYLLHSKRFTAGSFYFEAIPGNEMNGKKERKIAENVCETCALKESLYSSFSKTELVDNIQLLTS